MKHFRRIRIDGRNWLWKVGRKFVVAIAQDNKEKRFIEREKLVVVERFSSEWEPKFSDYGMWNRTTGEYEWTEETITPGQIKKWLTGEIEC